MEYYVKLKDVLRIVDTVSSDEGIRKKCKAIRKRLKELPKYIRAEPLWCQDCEHFINVDMGGEGECGIDKHHTWYACAVCRNFEFKKEGAENG